MGDDHLKPYLYALSRFMAEGHVCLPIKHALLQDEDFWIEYHGGKPENLRFPENSGLLGKDDSALKPFVFHHEKLYLHRYFHYESRIIERIETMHQKSRQELSARWNELQQHKDKIREFLQDMEATATQPPTQSNDGNEALLQAWLRQVSVITGGPGTGKTTLIQRIVKMMRILDPHLTFAFAAFTGKASGKMREKLEDLLSENDHAPSTIHRLLGPKGLNSNFFKAGKDKPLKYKVVIVDECSMIGTPLFAKLLDALSDDTRLILLGDADQLPSIDAGTIFGDLCKALDSTPPAQSPSTAFSYCAELFKSGGNTLPADATPGILSRLTQNYRFPLDSHIGKVVQQVIHSEADVVTQIGTEPAVLEWDKTYSDATLKNFCHKFIPYILEPDIKTAIDKFNKVRILCAVNSSDQGVDALNAAVETILKRILREEPYKVKLNTQNAFYEHQPIMVTKNDKELNLFNGDVGIVRKLSDDGPLMVCFPSTDPSEIGAYWKDGKFQGFKAIQPAVLSDRTTVYAMTIHKSQGSEFNDILIVLPKLEEQRLLTAELLYTAITRWKDKTEEDTVGGKVVLQSTPEVLEKTIQNRIDRISGIQGRLSINL